MKKKIGFKIFGIIFLAGFILLNIIAYNNAYHFTHFSQSANIETQKPENLSIWQKVDVLFFGVRKAKSTITARPSKPYRNLSIPFKADTLSAWLIPVENSKGLIISFHGYTSNKSHMLAEADAFNELGYTVLLVDLPGHGESSGYKTTIGYFEADDVAAAYNYVVKNALAEKIYLHGISMGAVSVLGATSRHNIKPSGIIAECPYGSMLYAAKNRFAIMGVPSFPAANLLVFWGGLQNGFWAFDNNTIAFAKKIKTPTLLLYGQGDTRATENEIMQIYNNLKCPKTIKRFDNAGHESYCKQNNDKWKQAVKEFLDRN